MASPQGAQDPAGERPVDPESLPEIYQELEEVLGLEVVLRLARYVGGMTLYFPKLERVETTLRDRRIRREYNGVNCRELARRYGLTARRVREVVKRGR